MTKNIASESNLALIWIIFTALSCVVSWFDDFFLFLEEKVEVEEEEEEEEEEQSENEPSFSVNPDTPVGHDYVRQVSFISVSFFWENLWNRGK